MTRPAVVFGTPRKLPKAAKLVGRVVVLDIAFAAGGTGASFEKVTEAFIKALGPRLAAWIDHHDHEFHVRYKDDPRFVLRKKSEHGACPEMVTPERVAAAGEVGTVVCHDDLDGLYAAAKWLRGGHEPYPGSDDDARAVDTRIGVPSALGEMMDRALRARPKDDAFRERVVTFLADGASDATLRAEIESVSADFRVQEENARTLAKQYQLRHRSAVVDATGFTERVGPYDKTLVLLLGQEIAQIAVLIDDQTVTLAAAFDSGINLLEMLGIAGGMPTRVSVPRQRLDDVFAAIAARN